MNAPQPFLDTSGAQDPAVGGNLKFQLLRVLIQEAYDATAAADKAKVRKVINNAIGAIALKDTVGSLGNNRTI